MLRSIALVCITLLLSTSLTIAQTEEQSTTTSAVLMLIRPEGFDHRQVAIATGRTLFVFQNRSGSPHTALQLDLETAKGYVPVFLPNIEGKPGATRTLRVPGTIPNWSFYLTLDEGRYRLSDGKHTKWVCTINVTTSGSREDQ